jgi:hypothetical protein
MCHPTSGQASRNVWRSTGARLQPLELERAHAKAVHEQHSAASHAGRPIVEPCAVSVVDEQLAAVHCEVSLLLERCHNGARAAPCLRWRVPRHGESPVPASAGAAWRQAIMARCNPAPVQSCAHGSPPPPSQTASQSSRPPKMATQVYAVNRQLAPGLHTSAKCVHHTRLQQSEPVLFENESRLGLLRTVQRVSAGLQLHVRSMALDRHEGVSAQSYLCFLGGMDTARAGCLSARAPARSPPPVPPAHLFSPQAGAAARRRRAACVLCAAVRTCLQDYSLRDISLAVRAGACQPAVRRRRWK